MLVVPSRVEAFGQTATESWLAKLCRSLWSYRILDIVDHKLNGYPAKPFESEDQKME